MSPAVLLSTIESAGPLPLPKNSRYTLDPLLKPNIMEALSTLAQLPDDDGTISGLQGRTGSSRTVLFVCTARVAVLRISR